MAALFCFAPVLFTTAFTELQKDFSDMGTWALDWLMDTYTFSLSNLMRLGKVRGMEKASVGTVGSRT